MRRGSKWLFVVATWATVSTMAFTAFAHPHEGESGAAGEPVADASEDPPPEAEGGEGTVPGIGELRPLRFVDRRHVLFRLGFGGTYSDAVLGETAASPTFGATLRWERPVHEYITTGLGFSFYTAKAKEEVFYEPSFDIDYNLKGRYPFQVGRKSRKLEAEVYLLVQGGLTIWIDSAGLDLIGPGWNVGIAPGFLFFINSRIGLLAELGWMRTEAFFSTGRFTIELNQGVFRIGPVFPF